MSYKQKEMIQTVTGGTETQTVKIIKSLDIKLKHMMYNMRTEGYNYAYCLKFTYFPLCMWAGIAVMLKKK
jgi:hypothetical protein